MGKVVSSLGLEDTLPFGKYKSRVIKEVYKQDANYLLWMRDAKANPDGSDSGVKQPPNREFFDKEVLFLLDEHIKTADAKTRIKYELWNITMSDPDDTPFESSGSEVHYYNEWGTF